MDISTNKVREILNFIDESTFKIARMVGKRHAETTIILIPFLYKNYIEIYIVNSSFSPLFPNYEKTKEIEYCGYTLKFISPTNDCYVFHENYQFCNPKDEFWFKLNLD